MNAASTLALDALTRAILFEFAEYQKRKAQAADWKPSMADIEEFLTQIREDSPEALKAKVAKALGVEWPVA